MVLSEFPILTPGANGVKTKLLQQTLLKAGEQLPVYGVDGYYGPETKEAVKGFQRKHDLTVDGIAGPEVYGELKYYNYPNFKKHEFKCGCGGRYCNGHPVSVDEQLLVVLQDIRDNFNRPVVVNSALRCKQWNRRVGGVSNSTHLRGIAADIVVPGITPIEVYRYCDKLLKSHGVGKYRTHTHVDVRGYRARW